MQKEFTFKFQNIAPSLKVEKIDKFLGAALKSYILRDLTLIKNASMQN